MLVGSLAPAAEAAPWRAYPRTDHLLGVDGAGAEKDLRVVRQHRLEERDDGLADRSHQGHGDMRAVAGVYMFQSSWDKAEPYMVRALKAVEVANGPDDGQVLVPLWGLCDLYDRMGKADQSQPCWHRATGLVEKQSGESSRAVTGPLSNEAKALRRLGRNDEAEKLEQRLAQINRTTAQAN